MLTFYHWCSYYLMISLVTSSNSNKEMKKRRKEWTTLKLLMGTYITNSNTLIYIILLKNSYIFLLMPHALSNVIQSMLSPHPERKQHVSYSADQNMQTEIC